MSFVSGQAPPCRSGGVCLLFLVLVCQVGPKYIEEDLAAVKVLGSDVGLALGGMGDVVVFPTRFLIHLAA